MRKLLALVLCVFLMVPAALAEEADYTLPIDFSGGYKPNAANFTKDSYEDASVSIQLEKRDIEGVRYDIAWIKIQSPTQLRTCIAGTPQEEVADKPTRMARKVNAVLAVNGDFYTQRDDGLIIRQGVPIIYDINPEKDVLIIDENGDMHAFLGSDTQVQEIVDFLSAGHTIVNAFTFGPALVKDGQALPMPATYKTRFDSTKRSPRTVVAQTGPLEYVFVEAEGRNAISKGVTTDQMAAFMAELGVQTAYCMDGGNTCIMLLNGKYYDSNYRDSERDVSDIIYIATAVPEE